MTERHPPSRRRRAPRRRHRTTAALLGLMCSIAVVGCGAASASNDVASLGDGTSGTTPPTTAAATDPQEAMMQFAKCMREHGIDMPDPKMAGGSSASGSSGGSGPMIVNSGGGDSPVDKDKMDAADKACRHFMDGVAQNAPKIDPAEEAKMKDQALAFSKCMREHGIDMPDPQFSNDGGGLSVSIGSKDGSGPKVDPTSPAFKDAQKACEEFMPKGGSLSTDDGSGNVSGSGGGAVTQVSPDASTGSNGGGQ